MSASQVTGVSGDAASAIENFKIADMARFNEIKIADGLWTMKLKRAGESQYLVELFTDNGKCFASESIVDEKIAYSLYEQFDADPSSIFEALELVEIDPGAVKKPGQVMIVIGYGLFFVAVIGLLVWDMYVDGKLW